MRHARLQRSTEGGRPTWRLKSPREKFGPGSRMRRCLAGWPISSSPIHFQRRGELPAWSLAIKRARAAGVGRHFGRPVSRPEADRLGAQGGLAHPERLDTCSLPTDEEIPARARGNSAENRRIRSPGTSGSRSRHHREKARIQACNASGAGPSSMAASRLTLCRTSS